MERSRNNNQTFYDFNKKKTNNIAYCVPNHTPCGGNEIRLYINTSQFKWHGECRFQFSHLIFQIVYLKIEDEFIIIDCSNFL